MSKQRKSDCVLQYTQYHYDLNCMLQYVRYHYTITGRGEVIRRNQNNQADEADEGGQGE